MRIAENQPVRKGAVTAKAGNGNGSGASDPQTLDMRVMLRALQAV